MKKKLFQLTIALLTAFLALPLCALDAVTVKLNKDSHTYHLGEEAVFFITGTEKGKAVSGGKCQAQFLAGGATMVKSVPVDFSVANPARVNFQLTEPGFVLLKLCDEKGKTLALAGAAFSPEKLRKGFAVPKDFLAFWKGGCDRIADTPVQLTKDAKRSNDKYTLYSISVKSLNDETITGYLSIPTGKGPFPAFITVPGAGPGISGPASWASQRVITLSMNVHKFPTADNAAEQKKRYQEDQKNGFYARRGAGDRERYFFRSVYVGMNRMIDYVANLKEWDRKHMVILGSSQGGGSALILTGLNKNITAVAANVPALCDHGAALARRAPGWPELFKAPGLNGYAPYYDAANFATLIKVPALVSCGFIDVTCPPSSVYAAYNELRGKKKMLHVVKEGHSYSKLFTDESGKFVTRHLGR